MASKISMNSRDSDVFFVEQLSNQPSPQRNNSPSTLNSTELLWAHAREMATTSSVASPEPHIVTFDDDSIEPTMPYGFGRQLPIIPPSFNDPNLPPNTFNILEMDDNIYSPQSPEPSASSPISTPSMNFRTIDGWETMHTTTEDKIYHSEDEPRRVHCTSHLDEMIHLETELRQIYMLSSPSPPSPHRMMGRKLDMGMSFPKRG